MDMSSPLGSLAIILGLVFVLVFGCVWLCFPFVIWQLRDRMDKLVAAIDPLMAQLKRIEMAQGGSGLKRKVELEKPKAISFSCSNCSTRLTVDASDAGSDFMCPKCSEKGIVPDRSC